MEAVATKLSNDPGWSLRADLALCYRVVAHYGLTDQIYTHISARVPGTQDRFWLNRIGVGFDEMTAGDLIEVGFDAPPEEEPGEVPGEAPGDVTADQVNRAGHTIHSAILMARDEVGCALHLHSRAGMAVAALEEGLMPLNQISMQFYDRISYHDYEGIALDLDEIAGGHLVEGDAQAVEQEAVLGPGDARRDVGVDQIGQAVVRDHAVAERQVDAHAPQPVVVVCLRHGFHRPSSSIAIPSYQGSVLYPAPGSRGQSLFSRARSQWREMRAGQAAPAPQNQG